MLTQEASKKKDNAITIRIMSCIRLDQNFLSFGCLALDLPVRRGGSVMVQLFESASLFSLFSTSIIMIKQFSKTIQRQQNQAVCFSGKRIFYQQLAPNVIHLPGENPNAATLAGTNCFVIGTSKDRTMIDAGDLPGTNRLFLENLQEAMEELNFRINRVFVCHAISNHFGGAMDVINLHRKMNHPPPAVYKNLASTKSQTELLLRFPELREHIHQTTHNDSFLIEETSCSEQTILNVIETPGHRADHLSFSITNGTLQQHSLFPGDMILGSRSVSMDDYDQYMKDLEKCLAMDFDYMYLSHSISMDAADVKMNAREKITQYINYRLQRKKLLVQMIKEHGQVSRSELFYEYYIGENFSDPLLLKLATTSFNSLLRKLRDDKVISMDEENVKIVL